MIKHRVSRSKIMWQEQINRWSNSGLSKSEYCRRHNISESGFYAQLRKRNSAREIQLVEVPKEMIFHDDSQIDDSGISVELPNGIKLNIKNSFVSETLLRLTQSLICL